MGNQKRTRSHDRHIEPQAPAQPRKVAKKSSYECRRDLFSKKKSVQCDMEEEDEEGGGGGRGGRGGGGGGAGGAE